MSVCVAAQRERPLNLTPLRAHYTYAMAAKSDLETQFEAALEEVQTAGDWSKAIPNDRKLLCYGLYKQVKEGDVKGSQPWAVQYEKRAKWDAWKTREGMTKEACMSEYIAEWQRQKDEFQK